MQPTGYRSFIPAPLPPVPAIAYENELLSLLCEADRSLGRLDGVATILPNPDLFVAMFVKHEAVLSSQIEGTQSSLGEVLRFEIEPTGIERPQDVQEVVNYVGAMNHGLDRLTTLPLSLRLIKEIHAKLLEGARGGQQSLGEFRESQNWIGPSGSTLANATFVPPPAHEMNIALGDFENFLRATDSCPVLIRCGLAHAQFETIHPFLDGNGRIGRLLITFMLCQQRVLQRPLLYLSYYLKIRRTEYYDCLTAIREHGDWESWIKFFLRGVHEVSEASTSTARAILALRERHRELLSGSKKGTDALRLLDFLFRQPAITIKLVSQELACSFAKAQRLIERFVQLHILTEVTGQERSRQYRYEPYLQLFQNNV